MEMEKGKERNLHDMMKVQDVADYLRLSQAKVYRMANSGDLPCLRLGKTLRFKREILDEWIRRETRGGQASEEPFESNEEDA